MLRAKRRETEIFSLSFMDCICCGFGAVLLIFILTTGKKVEFSQQDLDNLRSRVRQLERQITTEKAEIEKMANVAALTEADLKSLLDQVAGDEKRLTDRKEEMRLLLQQMGSLKKEQDKLLEDKKNLPKEDEQPVPIPNVDRQQYLTGVKLEGDYVLFLVRTSGSMLGETLDDAVARLGDPDFKKREAPKWQRMIASIEWMIANLDPKTHFQVLLFADTTVRLLPNREDQWIARNNGHDVQEVLARLRQVVPQGSANLEQAFTTIRYLPRLPDAIVMFTDGLPTTSDTSPANGPTDDDARIRYFRYAIRQLPARIPVSTILFPMTGDPGAAALYWDLAGNTRGALVSPSTNWPNT